MTGKCMGQTRIAVCQGSILTNDARAIMSCANVGNKIFIDAIKVKLENGEIKTMPGITITVK
jgi:hypothetical protein